MSILRIEFTTKEVYNIDVIERGYRKKEVIKMTERQIANRIKKLKELEAQQDILQQQIDVLKAEIQAEMNDNEIMTVCDFVVHWCKVVTSRLDTKRIKEELPDIYSKYIKETHSRRFSISTK